MTRWRGPVAAALLGLTAACATTTTTVTGTTAAAGRSTTSTAPGVTLTTGPTVTAVAVVSCPTSYGAGGGSAPFVAKTLAVGVPAAGLAAYSNGRLTVLAPAGWSCTALVAADGGQSLTVAPPGSAAVTVGQVPAGDQVVRLEQDYTGHGPGAMLVCPLFPGSPAVTFLQGSPPCPTVPSAEGVRRVTADVVAFTDPAHVAGTGAGSGGGLPSLGAAVYPQTAATASVTVDVLSCTLPADGLCPAVEADFVARYQPVVPPGTG